MSEFDRQAHVELAACEVVWNGVLYVVYVSNPIVTAHVADVEQVEYINSEPHALE